MCVRSMMLKQTYQISTFVDPPLQCLRLHPQIDLSNFYFCRSNLDKLLAIPLKQTYQISTFVDYNSLPIRYCFSNRLIKFLLLQIPSFFVIITDSQIDLSNFYFCRFVDSIRSPLLKQTYQISTFVDMRFLIFLIIVSNRLIKFLLLQILGLLIMLYSQIDLSNFYFCRFSMASAIAWNSNRLIKFLLLQIPRSNFVLLGTQIDLSNFYFCRQKVY